MVTPANNWLPIGLLVFLGLGLGAGLVACEDPRQGPPAAVASQVVSDADREAAQALLGQLLAIAAPPARADTLLRAADVAALLALIAPAELALAGPAVEPMPPDILDGCMLTTGTTATLSECELGDHVIDGTWSLQYHATHAELVDVFVVGPGHHGSLWIDARLSGTELAADALPGMPPAGGIDGVVEVSLMWTAGGQEHALDASIRVEGLVVDPAGDPAASTLAPRPLCAIGGVITIRGRMTSGEESQTTVWLGPGCGDVHVARTTS